MSRTDYNDYIILCTCGKEAEIKTKTTVSSIMYWVECPNCGKQGSKCYARSRAIALWNKQNPKAVEMERAKRQFARYRKKKELQEMIHEYCAMIRQRIDCCECLLNDTPACVSETPTVAQLEKAVKMCKEKYGELKKYD